jgi:CDP-diacylglycerol--glycerol-3-phosphate 3-phosphatidyltransferase
MATRTGTFGPSAIATPANGVTLARVVMTPLLLAWIVESGASWPAEALWIVLSLTDGIDGFLARRHGSTRSGAFLDPLADKFLVLGAMVCLVHIDVFGWVPVALIAAREIAMSVYRAVVGTKGVSIPARRSAKLKTVVQDLAVGFALFPPIGDHHAGVARLVLWVAVALTLYTGAEYLRDARSRGDLHAV